MRLETLKYLDTKELSSVVYCRVKELYEAEINTKINDLQKLKENQSLDSMLKYLDLQVCLQLRGKKYIDIEKRAEICRENGRKGGAKKGNQNARKNKGITLKEEKRNYEQDKRTDQSF